MRVGSKLTTARRVAWELALGPIPPHQRLAACEVERGCVRVDHLHLGARPSDDAPVTVSCVPTGSYRLSGRRRLGGSRRPVLNGSCRGGQSASSVHQAAPVVLSGAFNAAHQAGIVYANPMLRLTLA